MMCMILCNVMGDNAKIEADMKTIANYKNTMLLINNLEDHFPVHLHNKDFFGCRNDFERLVRIDLLVNTFSQRKIGSSDGVILPIITY